MQQRFEYGVRGKIVAVLPEVKIGYGKRGGKQRTTEIAKVLAAEQQKREQQTKQPAEQESGKESAGSSNVERSETEGASLNLFSNQPGDEVSTYHKKNVHAQIAPGKLRQFSVKQQYAYHRDGS